MSSFQDYKRSLSDFDVKCTEVLGIPEPDCSVEFGSTIESLEINLGIFF